MRYHFVVSLASFFCRLGSLGELSVRSLLASLRSRPELVRLWSLRVGVVWAPLALVLPLELELQFQAQSRATATCRLLLKSRSLTQTLIPTLAPTLTLTHPLQCTGTRRRQGSFTVSFDFALALSSRLYLVLGWLCPSESHHTTTGGRPSRWLGNGSKRLTCVV